MSAVRPLETEQERRGQVSSLRAISRAAMLLFVLVVPVAAVVAVGVAAGLLRQRRVPAKLYLPIGIVVSVGVLLTGQLRPFLQPLTEIVQRARDAVAAAGDVPTVDQVVTPVLALAAERWPSWLLAVTPLSVALGLLTGAIWSGLQSRRRARWRDTPRDLAPVPAKKLAKAVATMPTWPAVNQTPRAGTYPSVKDLLVPIGINAVGSAQVFCVSVGELNYHGYIDGPTGFGKTTTIQEICAGVVEQPAAQTARCPLVFITMKPDREVSKALQAMARSVGRGFWRVTQDGVEGNEYNSFAGGDPFEIASAVLACMEQGAGGGFTEPHHREAGDRFLKFAARAMVEAHRRDPDNNRVDYATLSHYMNPGNIAVETDRFSPQLAREWAGYSQELAAEPDLNRSIAGLRQRVANAAEGGARDVLRATPDALHLERAIEAGDVVVFDLDAARDKTASRLIGNLAIQDLSATMARLGDRGWHHWRDDASELVRTPAGDLIQRRYCQIVVDEFSALGGSLVEDLFQRARGHGAGLLLGTQEKGSLAKVSDSFVETVIVNANVLMVHVQSMNAEFYANLYGTRTVMRESSQIFEEGSLVGQNVYKSGQGNISEADEYVVHPNQLRSLTQGEIFVRVLTRAGEPPSRVRVRRSVERRHRGADTLGPAAIATPPEAAGPDTSPSSPATPAAAALAEATSSTGDPRNPYLRVASPPEPAASSSPPVIGPDASYPDAAGAAADEAPAKPAPSQRVKNPKYVNPSKARRRPADGGSSVAGTPPTKPRRGKPAVHKPAGDKPAQVENAAPGPAVVAAGDDIPWNDVDYDDWPIEETSLESS